MDINIFFLPYDVNQWTVTRSIASILHSDEFAPRQRDPNAVDRVINFQVMLNKSKAGGVQNDGSGVLTLPTESIGNKFLQWVKDFPLRIEGKKVKFFRRGHAQKALALTLDKTPYIDPDNEEIHEQKVWDLRDSFRVDAVQFGVFYRAKYPTNSSEPLTPRAFSVEWERKYVTESIGWLAFEYDHKLIRIKLGNEMTEKIGSSIAISFASIQKMAVGYDGNPYICFDTLTPPILEEIQFHRALTGHYEIDNRKFKRRIGSLHPGHAIVAPYAQNLRIVLYSDPNIDVATKFIDMCKIAGLASTMIIRCEGKNKVEADKRGFFTSKRIHQLRNEFRRLPWQVAFQLESLLRNCLLHTEDIVTLLQPIRALCERKDISEVGDLLRKYHEKLEVRSLRESPLECFTRVLRHFSFLDSKLPPGNFRCSHVTFTPTRTILEGPYASQSNRVIREYQGYEDFFVRVDFRDEDRLQYRWDLEIDGSTHLNERVGGILKQGFELAGRHFEFLAYSNSALREHAVWFMSPFHHPEKGWVTSESIRKSLGDFDADLLKCPSKYAARLAQAFTATDPSVKISRNQWENVPDLGRKPYLFTDGVGTISKALGDRIWAALCAGREDHGSNVVQPSAYQIRFLGHKGVVSVDEQLDGNPNGILMRLRKSMEKFEVRQADEAYIEIAQAFKRPHTCYLNRPLVVVMEDQGVRIDAFTELQEIAVRDAYTIHDSYDQFRVILDNHSLGGSYRLSHLLKQITKLGLDLAPQDRTPSFDTPFLRLVREVSMLHVLRDIKHSARIPVPKSHLLVGIADEGPAYKKAGRENVYILPEGHIFACVQKSKDDEPEWLEGACSISRSPVVHPGDVQRVYAIGEPPKGMLCIFRNLKNVVVLPSVGERSLASCLGGGDVDGDLFSVVCYEPLLPSSFDDAANYPAGETFTLDRDSTVEDICDFIVQYIKSDVLGLLSDRLLVIAGRYYHDCSRLLKEDPAPQDQSKDGIRDENCRWLGELCSQAVDFPKQGIAVNIENNRLPRPLIRCKPDWHAAEVVSPRRTDYYESSRALGVMYRSITLDDLETSLLEDGHQYQELNDPISQRLRPLVEPYLIGTLDVESFNVGLSFRRYVDELRYICATHTISNAPGVRLLEAEVVTGTILAKCTQKRWRKDRMYRMRLHAQTLVRDIKREFMDDAGKENHYVGLKNAWKAWDFSQRQGNEFGAHSFGLIVLGVIFDCLESLGGIA